MNINVSCVIDYIDSLICWGVMSLSVIYNFDFILFCSFLSSFCCVKKRSWKEVKNVIVFYWLHGNGDVFIWIIIIIIKGSASKQEVSCCSVLMWRVKVPLHSKYIFLVFHLFLKLIYENHGGIFHSALLWSLNMDFIPSKIWLY